MRKFNEIPNQEIIQAIEECEYLSSVLKKLDCWSNQANREKLKKFIEINNIQTSFKTFSSKTKHDDDTICKDNINSKVLYCLNCGKEIKGRGLKYCNNKCQREYEYKQWIKRWKEGLETGLTGKYGISNSLRRYLLEKYNFKCSRCGWSKENPYTHNIPLEIEHIDGNYLNNTEENLTVLCPNCHSLTPTYKGSNKGHGRKERSKYYTDVE